MDDGQCMHLIGCDRAFDKETCAVRQSAKELHCMGSMATLRLVLNCVGAAYTVNCGAATLQPHSPIKKAPSLGSQRSHHRCPGILEGAS
jgi:hypothetical protein